MTAPSAAHRLLGATAALLGHRRLPWIACLLGVALAAPSLGTGLQTEDFVHREISQHAVGLPNLFGDPTDPSWSNYGAIDSGQLPWIAAPGLRLSFWRPLTSWTHHIDYRVFPDHPWVAHAHSLLWFALLLYAAARLYRRMLGSDAAWPAWAAGLATLLYALDDGHGTAVGWLANRNAVVAAALGFVAIEAHDRFRRDGWLLGAVAAPVLLFAGLLAGEVAVGAVGWLVAHTLVLDPAPFRRRLPAALPWLCAAAIWAALYRLGGHGAYASGAYLDPGSEPLRFLRAAAERLPLLLAGQLSGVPSELLYLVRFDHPAIVPLAGAALVAFLLLFLPLLRSSKLARFWAAGTVLSALPGCGTLPSDRLLFFAGLGGMGLLAMLVASAADRSAAAPSAAKRALATSVAAVLLVAHGPVAAVLLPLRAVALEAQSRWLDAASDSAFDAVRHPGEQLVILAAPDFYAATMLVALRVASGKPLPNRARVLYGGTDPLLVTRQDAQTLLLRPTRGFLARPFNRVYRGRDHAMRAGDGLQLYRLQIVVREVTELGSPLAVTFHFTRPLESPWFALVAWNGTRYAPWTPPPVGESVVLPALQW